MHRQGTRPSLRQVLLKLCITEKTCIPRALTNRRRILRCTTTASRMSRSVSLLVGGIPGCLRNVNRLGAAPARVVANLWSPYAATRSATRLSNFAHVAWSAPPPPFVLAATRLASRNIWSSLRYRSR